MIKALYRVEAGQESGALGEKTMGYTHYWGRVQNLDAKKFKAFSGDCAEIAKFAEREYGVTLEDGINEGPAQINENEIWINGDSKKGEDYETFFIPCIEDTGEVDEYGLSSNLCKTAQRPYDRVVCACLIAAKYHFPNDFFIRSDGEADDWTDGLILASAILGANLDRTIAVIFDRPSEALRQAEADRRRQDYTAPAPRRSISCVETAKLVRKELKKQFPGQKFSVRSDRYSGGSSIDVKWTNGPSEDAVQEVAGHFKGATFDSMTDCKRYNDSPYCNDYIFFRRDLDKNLYISEVKRISAELGYTVPENIQYNDVYHTLWMIGKDHGFQLEREVLNTIGKTNY